MKSDQIAINSISTTNESVEEMLEAYSAAGFRRVEFFLGFVKKWMKDKSKSVTDLKQLLADKKLQCIGGFEAHLVVFEEAEREGNHLLHVSNAQLLDQLGGGTIVIGTDGPKQMSIEALHHVGKTMRQLVERFPSTVNLALEFNWSPVVKSLKSADIAVQAADHPRVGILFDPAHFHCTASKLEDLTPEVISRIGHVHMDDMRDKPGDHSNCNDDRVLPGQGVLPLKEIVRRIDAGGYRGSYSIEMFNADLWKLPPDQAARQCYDSMKTLVS